MPWICYHSIQVGMMSDLVLLNIFVFLCEDKDYSETPFSTYRKMNWEEINQNGSLNFVDFL